jgi:hypothetical protein
MRVRSKIAILVVHWTRFVIVVSLLLSINASSAFAQQKPQWVPGQIGLNAGIMPSPGFTYANITLNYDAGIFKDLNGRPITVTGTYNVWAVENIFYWIANTRVLKGNIGGFVMFPTPATGSLNADISNINFPNLSLAVGGTGLADLWLQPLNIGWHLNRADLKVMDGFMIPTGRYTPGATDNIGTGYFGNHLQTGATFYITKNKGTSANLFTDWEVHGARPGILNTSKKPGQAFTDEWGLGQVLPLKKDLSQLLQVGGIGYDQWQITDNVGSALNGNIIVNARILPHYSVHAAGGQAVYIAPAKNLTLNFKYLHEYSAAAHTVGNTIAFGGTWSWLYPKPPKK